MRIRFGLKSLLVFAAIVAVGCFFWIQHSRVDRFAGISPGMCRVAVLGDGDGIYLQLQARTKLLKNLRIEIKSEDVHGSVMMTQVLSFEASDKKSIHIVQGQRDSCVLATTPQGIRVSLPQDFAGSRYQFQPEQQEPHVSQIGEGVGMPIHRLVTDRQEVLRVWFFLLH